MQRASYVLEVYWQCSSRFNGWRADCLFGWYSSLWRNPGGGEAARRCLQRLHELGLKAKLKKRQFHTQEVTFLCFEVSAEGIRIEDDLIQTIQNWPKPRYLRDVRAFTGTTGFYRRFVKRYLHIAKPLTDLTKKWTPFHWGPREQAAFDLVKNHILSQGRFWCPFAQQTDLRVYRC